MMTLSSLVVGKVAFQAITYFSEDYSRLGDNDHLPLWTAQPKRKSTKF